MSAVRWLSALPTGRRSKWLVVAVWVAALAAVGPFAGRLFDVVQDTVESYLPGDAESTRVLQLQERFPSGQVSPVVVLYQRPGGITEADQATAAADVDALAGRLDLGAEPGPPVPSSGGEALIVTLPVAVGGTGAGEAASGAVGEIRAVVGDGEGGLDVKVTGPGGLMADQNEVYQSIEGPLVIAPLLVVTVLLLLIYRSAVLWLVPLLVVVGGYAVATAVVYGVASGLDLTISTMSASVLGILVYGAGTDYALLLIARYREELRRQADHHDAMRTALRRSAPAIVAAGATTSLGLVVLLLAEQNATRGLGPVGLIAIGGAALAMLTLLPAVLCALGRRVFWPAVPRYRPDTTWGSAAAALGENGAAGQDATATPAADDASRLWQGIARLVGRRPRLVWVGSVLVLGALAAGLTGLDTPADRLFRDDPESVVGMRELATHYPDGQSTPLEIVARTSHAGEVAEAAGRVPGVVEVIPAEEAGGLTSLRATLEAEPDSAAEAAAVDAVRERVHAVEGAEALVGGQPAVNLDLNRANSRDNRVIIPLVLVVVLVILAVLLRSLVAPVMLIASVVLSFGAALGLTVLFFEQVVGWEGIGSELPLIAFVFLVALGVDYNVFLMSRAREEVGRLGSRLGMLRSLAVTGGVITSAGLVLAATFGVLVGMPMVQIIQIGFVVAAGILIDTMLVRSLLVPALAVDIGPRVWWPSRLARPEWPSRDGGEGLGGELLSRPAPGALLPSQSERHG